MIYFFESNCSTVCGVHDCVHEIKEKEKRSCSSEHQGEEAICKLFMQFITRAKTR